MIQNLSHTWQVGDITIRPASLPDDLAHLTQIGQAHDLYVRGATTYDEHEAQEEFTAPDFVIEDSVRLAFAPDGTCIGIGVVYDTVVKVRPNIWGFVRSEWRNKGIGTALFDWEINRAKQNIDRVPSNAKVTLQAWTVSHDASGAQLMRDQGFTTERCGYTMQINFTAGQRPPPPIWPDGVELRSMADGVSLETIVRAYDESFKDHRGHLDLPFEERLKTWEHWFSNDNKLDPKYIWVAYQNGELAGVCATRPEAWDSAESAYVATLGTLRAFRKQGLASALLNHTFTTYYDLGKKAVNLGVDGSSLTNAVRLYESVGMHIQERRDTYELVVRDGIELTNQG
jgi:GNAT superfamily N-acetyltransferase